MDNIQYEYIIHLACWHEDTYTAITNIMEANRSQGHSIENLFVNVGPISDSMRSPVISIFVYGYMRECNMHAIALLLEFAKVPYHSIRERTIQVSGYGYYGNHVYSEPAHPKVPRDNGTFSYWLKSLLRRRIPRLA